MCLHSVSRTKPKSEGIGWKIVEINIKTKRPYCGAFSFKDSHRKIITKRWLNSVNPKEKLQYTDNGRTYSSGFHLFATKKDAEKFHKLFAQMKDRIIRIDYREAHTQGKQRNIPVIVANKIRLHVPKSKRVSN